MRRDESTLSQLLQKLFYALLLWFPCQFAFSLAWGKLSEIQPDFIFLGALYSLAVFGAGLWLSFPKGGLTAKAGAKLLVFLCAAAALIRIWVILVLQNPPLSNYQEAHESASALLAQGIGIFHPRQSVELATDELALYHTIYPSWALYMLMLKNIYAVFGDSVFVGQYLNVALCVLIMAGLYLLCVRYLKKPGLGLAAAAVFAFWPPSILYTVLHSPDYFTILLTVVCLLLWGWVEERRESSSWWAHLLRLTAVGVTLGVLDRFKSVAAVFLAALFIYEAVCHILPALCKRLREKAKGFGKALGTGALTIVSVAAVMVLTTGAVDAAIGRNIGHTPQNLTGWFFYAGLTGEDGMWNEQKRGFRDHLLEQTGYDVDAVNRELMRATWNQVDTYTRATWEMILSKTEIFWTDDLDLYRCMYGHTIDHLYFEIKGSARVYYMALLLFQLLGVLALLCAPFKRERENRLIFLTALLLFGFALLFLVSEMQIRYKFILAAPMSLLAANGIAALPQAAAFLAGLFGRKRAVKASQISAVEAADLGGETAGQAFSEAAERGRL